MAASVSELLPAGLDEEFVRQLPGAELVLPGLEDLAAGRPTRNAIIAGIAGANLRRLGFTVPHSADPSPEDALYADLHTEDEDSAHGRYNAIVRRLVSFERAAAHAVRWTHAPAR